MRDTTRRGRRGGRRAGLAGTAWLVAVAWGAPAAGQARSIEVEAIRGMLLEGLETHRAMDLAVVRAIPDSALRWAPTPGVRDFAQQVEHIALDNPLIVAAGLPGVEAPSFGEPEAYLESRAELERLVEETYDWVVALLRELPAERLVEETRLFGRPLPTWRLFLVALHHADWTRGQLVPYFRLHGVEPPSWRFY